MITDNSFCFLNYPPKKYRKMALQVHDRPSCVLPSKERAAPGRRKIRGSLTLEAALVLPLFLFAMYLLILPMRMMGTARRMQEICERLCRDAAEGSYLLTLKEEDGGRANSESAGATENARSVQGYLKGNALGLLAVECAGKEIDDPYVVNLHALRSHAWGSDQMITLTMDYDYRLPFSVLGIGSVHQRVSSSRRAWVGGRKSAEENDGANGGEGDELVYVGQSGTRYHSSLRCHYLSNSLTAVPRTEISSRRNSEGGKYHACPRCASQGGTGAVYIMPSGRAYHSDPACSAICSYARSVKKSAVEHLGPCQYCYGKGR